MNCREFENKWNELLDAHLAGSSQFEQAMETHASTCERCRSVSSRYQVLRQAISAWSAPPVPSAESIERLYELTVPSTPLRIPSRRLAIGPPGSRWPRRRPCSPWPGSAGRPGVSRPLPEDFAPALIPSTFGRDQPRPDWPARSARPLPMQRWPRSTWLSKPRPPPPGSAGKSSTSTTSWSRSRSRRQPTPPTIHRLRSAPDCRPACQRERQADLGLGPPRLQLLARASPRPRPGPESESHGSL